MTKVFDSKDLKERYFQFQNFDVMDKNQSPEIFGA